MVQPYYGIPMYLHIRHPTNYKHTQRQNSKHVLNPDTLKRARSKGFEVHKAEYNTNTKTNVRRQ